MGLAPINSVEKLETEWGKVVAILQQFQKTISTDKELLNNYTSKVDRLELVQNTFIKPEVDALKNVLEPLKTKLADLSNTVDKFAYRLEQYSSVIGKIDHKQDEINNRLHANRDLYYEVKTLHQQLDTMFNTHRQNVEDFEERFDKLEETTRSNTNKIDAIYHTKRIIWSAAAVIGALITFFILVKDNFTILAK